MKSLAERYQADLLGVLSCYDRMIITGILPGACYAGDMTSFLNSRRIKIFDYAKLFADPLRGWVNYFAIGHSSKCFNYIQDWVEKKVRRHLMRSRKRRGFGWQRWSRRWLYDKLGLFRGYRMLRPESKATPAG